MLRAFLVFMHESSTFSQLKRCFSPLSLYNFVQLSNNPFEYKHVASNWLTSHVGLFEVVIVDWFPCFPASHSITCVVTIL